MPRCARQEIGPLTEEHLRASIDDQDEFFDSHNVIETIMRRWPQDYVKALHNHVERRDPITYLHSLIGRSLAELARAGVIRRRDRGASGNVRRRDTGNQKWARLKPTE